MANNDNIKGFHWLDYLLSISTVLLSLGVGLFHSYGQKTTQQYLSGNRQLSPLPVALSMLMSLTSGITVLGSSAEMYLYGTQMWMISFAQSLACIISVHLFIPVIYNLQVTSIFEYHNKRYGSPLLLLICMIMYILYSLGYMGIAMYAPATALESVTGFPVWASLICTGLIVIVYTSMGGIKAVVWTDFIQTFILYVGLLIVVVAGCAKVGGIYTVWEISKKGGRINFFNMNPDPTERLTFWSVMIGQCVLSIAQTSIDQTQVQRYCSLPTLKHAKITILLEIPFVFLVHLLVNLCGLTAFAYYDKNGCDPFRSKAISSSNHIIPYFLVDAVNINGLTGLFVAVLFSGGLSTFSSSMNSLAAITWKHYLEPHLKNIPENRKTYVTKFTSFSYGIIGLSIGFIMKYVPGPMTQVATSILLGSVGPTAGVVIAGILFSCVQYKGIIAGFLSGIGVYLWITIGQFVYYPHRTYLDTTVDNCTFSENNTVLEIPEDLNDVFWVYRLSYFYIGVAGILTTLVVSFVVSILTGREDINKLDPMTVMNIRECCYCCLPPTTQRCCKCRASYESNEDISNGKEMHLCENEDSIC